VFKNQKIKRYKSIYSKKASRSPLMIGGAAVVVFALAFVGWSIYPSVYDFVMAIGHGPKSGIVDQQPTPGTDQPVASQPESPDPQQSTPPAEPTPVATTLKGVYAPNSIVSDPQKLEEFLKGLRGTGVNAVMVDGKDSEGAVLYRSQVAMAMESGAVAANAFDAKTVVNKITAEGMTPIVKINAFKDPLAARANRKAAVSYMGSDFSWLDNSPDLGGRPWLNPFSDLARGYIKDIAAELASYGFKQVVIESVQFPTGVGLEKADYGAPADSPARLTALKSFAKEIEETVAAAGGKAAVYLKGTAILTENAMIYGGNPLEIPLTSSVVEMISTNFTPNTAVGDTMLTSPQTEFDKTVSAISRFALSKMGSGAQMTALIAGTTKDGTILPLAAIDQQVKALDNSGAAGYIIYSPSGKYGLK